MKKLLTTIMILAILTTSAFAGCWMNQAGRFVRWDKPTTIKYNGLDYFSTNHSIENLEAAGYYYIENTPDCPIWEMYYDYDGLGVYQLFYETNNIQIPIDSDTQQMANIFKLLLNTYFGTGSETNTNIGVKYVTEFFTAKVLVGTITTAEIAHSTVLKEYFALLSSSPYNPVKGTTWSFPFNKTEIETSILKRYYIDSLGIKHYLE